MEAGEPVPAAAAAMMVRGLRKYLEGAGNDITRNLGLRPRKGGRHEAPLAAERRRQRDALILRVFDAQAGKKSKKAGQVAAMLAGRQPAAEITDAELCEAMQVLRLEYGHALPTSTRQVLRVVAARS
jgi:hypothetical protein